MAEFFDLNAVPGEPPKPPPREGKSLGDVARNVVQAPFRAAGALDVALGIKSPEEAEERTQRYTGYATKAAETAPFGLVGKGGQLAKMGAEAMGAPALVAKAAPVVGRVLTGAGIGGAEGSLAGESALGGAAASAAGGAIAEGAGLVISKALSQLLTPEIRRAGAAAVRSANEQATRAWETATGAAKSAWEAGAQRLEQTYDVAQRMSRDYLAKGVGERIGELLPELAAFKSSLFEMARSKQATKALDMAFDSAKAEILSRIGGGRAKWIKIPELSEERMTLEQAITALTRQGGHLGRGAERTTAQNLAAFDYGRAREQFMAELNRLDPSHGAGKIWDEAMKARSAAKAFTALITKSLDASGELDPRKLIANTNRLAQSMERKFGPYYEEAQAALLGGPGRRVPFAVPPKMEAPKPAPFEGPPRPEPKRYEPKSRLETLLTGPEIPRVRVGGMRVPTQVPEGAQRAATTVGAAVPTIPLGLAGMASEAMPWVRGRRHDRLEEQ